MAVTFCTVGHSTRTVEEFVALLQAAEVTRVVDIRTVPKSRTNPQYNADVLAEHLTPYGIDYQLLAGLGGLRNKSKTIAPEVNGFWKNQSFHNYADYALSDEFQTALTQLIDLGQRQRCAIMCAEAVWWRCHRRIVADHLIAHGYQVLHLMGKDRIDAAEPTKGAKIQKPASVTYPTAE